LFARLEVHAAHPAASAAGHRRPLLLWHLRDHDDAARKFGEPLLELLAVIVRAGLFDLRLELGDAPLDIELLAGAADNRGTA
jgi:hypothetical protein